MLWSTLKPDFNADFTRATDGATEKIFFEVEVGLIELLNDFHSNSKKRFFSTEKVFRANTEVT